jgi:hypothetical protein
MTSGNAVTTTINVSESRSWQNTVELLVPSGTFDNLTVSATLSGPLPTTIWRTNGNVIKVQIGGTNASVVTIQYVLHPAAQDDDYLAIVGTQRTVSDANGVLQNDVSPRGLPLAAVQTGGSISLSGGGGFSFTPGSAGTYTFTYNASDGVTHSTDATATIRALPSNTYLAEDFSDPTTLQNSWTQVAGKWTVTNGVCVAGPHSGGYGTLYHAAQANWTGD